MFACDQPILPDDVVYEVETSLDGTVQYFSFHAICQSSWQQECAHGALKQLRLMERPLTLDGVPDAMLAEYGFTRGEATEAAYRCVSPVAVLIPLADLIFPAERKLNEDAVRSLLAGVRDRSPIEPVPVVREPGAAKATLLDGMHRFQVSKAVGFTAIPCTYLSCSHAEVMYGYLSPPASTAL